MTEEAVKLAKEQVETTDLSDDRVLVIYLPDCHESLGGDCCGKNKGMLLQTGIRTDGCRGWCERIRTVDRRISYV